MSPKGLQKTSPTIIKGGRLLLRITKGKKSWSEFLDAINEHQSSSEIWRWIKNLQGNWRVKGIDFKIKYTTKRNARSRYCKSMSGNSSRSMLGSFPFLENWSKRKIGWPDDMMLKRLSLIAKKTFLQMINRELIAGTLPESWKHSAVSCKRRC